MFLLCNGSCRESSLKCDFAWPSWRKRRGSEKDSGDELLVVSNWSARRDAGFPLRALKEKGDPRWVRAYCDGLRQTKVLLHPPISLCKNLSWTSALKIICLNQFFHEKVTSSPAVFFITTQIDCCILKHLLFLHTSQAVVYVCGSSCLESCNVVKLEHL